MAAPMVSGAAALLLQKYPSLTPDQVKARLMKTATTFPAGYSISTHATTGQTFVIQYDVFTIGAGYLNIPAALSNSDVWNGTALSPQVTYDSASGNTCLFLTNYGDFSGGSAAPWGTTAVWGTTAAWGTTAVWGTTATQGFTAVWGATAVFGSSTSSDARALLTAIHGGK